MKNFNVRSGLICLMGMSMILALGNDTWAVAEAPISAVNAPKFGVIDMQAVILNVEEGKKARAELEKEIQSKEKDFLKTQSELETLGKTLQEQSSLLSEAARRGKQEEFQQKMMQLNNDKMSFGQEIKRKEQQATQQIAVKVAKIVETIASQRKLEAVFEQNTSGLLFLDNPAELTKEVIAQFAKDYPASAGKTAKKN